jgi:hypothetical protein
MSTPIEYLNFSKIDKLNPYISHSHVDVGDSVVRYYNDGTIIGPPIYDVWHELNVDQQNALLCFWEAHDPTKSKRRDVRCEEVLFDEELRIAIELYCAASHQLEAYERAICHGTAVEARPYPELINVEKWGIGRPNIVDLQRMYVVPSYTTLELFQSNPRVEGWLERLVRLHNNLTEYIKCVQIIPPKSNRPLAMWKSSKAYVATKTMENTRLRGFSLFQLAAIIQHPSRCDHLHLSIFQDARDSLSAALSSLLGQCVENLNCELFNIFVGAIVSVWPYFKIDHDRLANLIRVAVRSQGGGKNETFYKLLARFAYTKSAADSTHWTPEMFIPLKDTIPYSDEYESSGESDDEVINTFGGLFLVPHEPDDERAYTPISACSKSDDEDAVTEPDFDAADKDDDIFSSDDSDWKADCSGGCTGSICHCGDSDATGKDEDDDIFSSDDIDVVQSNNPFLDDARPTTPPMTRGE